MGTDVGGGYPGHPCGAEHGQRSRLSHRAGTAVSLTASHQRSDLRCACVPLG